jgi:hypothetical protein
MDGSPLFRSLGRLGLALNQATSLGFRQDLGDLALISDAATLNLDDQVQQLLVAHGLVVHGTRGAGHVLRSQRSDDDLHCHHRPFCPLMIVNKGVAWACEPERLVTHTCKIVRVARANGPG